MRKIIVVTAAVCLLIISGAIFWAVLNPKNSHQSTLSNQDRQKALNNILGREASLNEKSESSGTEKYKGKYYEVSIPEGASRPEHDLATPPILEAQNFNLQIDRILISVIVKDASNTGSITDDSGVALRLKDKSNTHSSITVDGTATEEFSNSNSTELTLFLLKDKRLFSIAVSGSSPSKVQTSFNTLANSFHAL